MLTKPGANVISSTDGWEVEILGLTGMTYRDSTGTYAVDSEMLHGEPAFVVIRDGIFRVTATGVREPVDDGRKNRIVNRIRNALLWDGHEIAVV